jgi:hypothetical protein
MIEYTTAKDDDDLRGIIDLQRRNLPVNLSSEEMKSQGFVTVVHDLSVLQKMHAIEPSVVARDNGRVIAYLLAMTVQSRMDVPVLVPMFELFDSLAFRGKPLSAQNYIVVGQVCVDKVYRGQGILDTCYEHYHRCFSNKYDFAITEIASSNLRSLGAHRRVGFQTIHEYEAPDGEKWCIVLLAW